MSVITQEHTTLTNTFLSSEEISNIRQQAQLEFPNDVALQEVHIARRILATEAQRLGMNYLEYVRQIVQNMN